MNADDELQVMYDNWRRRYWQRLFGDLLLLGLAIVAAYITGIGFLIWFIVRQIREELNFRERYGVDWRSVYETYHGSLARAHGKIGVALFALLAIGAVSIWFYRRTFSKKSPARRHRHHRN